MTTTLTPSLAPQEARLRRHLEHLGRRGVIPAPQVLVISPRWRFEHGDLDRPTHAASCGKQLTTTLVAMQVERGALDYGTPIGRLLPTEDVADLPAVVGADPARDVTVEHLLTHTSGLPDYFEPPRGFDTAASFRSVVAHPNRRWTPRALLDEARRLPAVGAPGERFHYADTNFVLLGRIVEEATGETFTNALRRNVLEPAGMTRSTTPYDVTVAPESLAELDVTPFWIGRHELSRARSISLDWASGNVVGPPEDFVRFQQAFHGGELVSREHVEHLTRSRRRFRRGIHYGAGTMTLRFGELMPLVLRGLPEPVGHLGFLANHVFHYPEQDAYVVLNLHSHERIRQSFQVHARIARILAG
jgi:D-alanyl-D-alanine carboxypeptidase